MNVNAIKKYWEVRPSLAWKEFKDMKTYEEIRALRYSHQPYLLELFPEFKDKIVLEVGCGSGIDLVEFLKYTPFVCGIDITEKAIKITKGLLKLLHLKSTCIFTYNGYVLPFLDNSFDLVYSFGVIHHIPYPIPVVKEIYRVLKPNGKIYIMLYNKNSIFYNDILFQRGILEKELSKLSPSELFSKYSEFRIGCPYSKAYNEKEARELFRHFKDLSFEYHHNYYRGLDQHKIKIDFIPDGSKLGLHMIVKGKK